MTQWIVKLSNGETFREGEKPFDIIFGKKSPHLRLNEYMKNNNLCFSAVALEFSGKKIALFGYHDPLFAAYNTTKIPKKLNFFRTIGAGLKDKKIEQYTVLEAVYDVCTLQVWVDDTTGNSWSVIN